MEKQKKKYHLTIEILDGGRYIFETDSAYLSGDCYYINLEDTTYMFPMANIVYVKKEYIEKSVINNKEN